MDTQNVDLIGKIKDQDGFLGIMAIKLKSFKDGLTPNELQLLNTILNQLALTMRNIKLVEEHYILGGRSFRDAKHDYMRPIEKALVKEALKNANQNITKAAELLGMKRQYLQQKIKKLNLY